VLKHGLQLASALPDYCEIAFDLLQHAEDKPPSRLIEGLNLTGGVRQHGYAVEQCDRVAPGEACERRDTSLRGIGLQGGPRLARVQWLCRNTGEAVVVSALVG